MAFLVIAYPKLEDSDFKLIQNYRKDNDKLYSVVEPHFSIVFQVSDIEPELFIKEVTEKVSNTEKINFTLRCVTLNKDIFTGYHNVFLIADEGNSKIIKLHDKLYSGQLKNDHRLDIDYVPHITIGNSTDKFKCKQMVDKWNEKEFVIRGTIPSLTIVSYDNNRVTKLKEIALQ